MSAIFQLFADHDYKFGNCSVRVYDRFNTTLYPDDFLLQMYYGCKPRLATTFCGMHDLSAPSICAYLASVKPLLLMCVDNPDTENDVDIVGFAFPTIVAGPPMGKFTPDPGRTAFFGYCFFRDWWGRPEISVCMMLMGIYFFHTMNLLTMQGQRYPHNRLTAKFLYQFGVRDVGVLPKFLFDGEKMVDSVQSCLFREDFEDYVIKTMKECAVID
jgi:hypothetical protein